MSVTILEGSLSKLRFNCIWPSKGQELNPGRFYLVKFILMIISTTIILIGSSGHLIVSLQNGYNYITEDIVILIAEVTVYYYISVFVSYQKEIAEICINLSDFENYEKPYYFEEENRRLLRLSKIFTICINFAIIAFCLNPFLVLKKCQKRNSLQNFQEVCGLLVTTWFPFNVNRFPYKQVLYLWQFYSFYFIMKGGSYISLLIFESMEHLIIRIQHLKLMLIKAVETDDDHLRKQRLTACIQYHINLFEIGNKVNKCYTGCLFAHMLLSGALFGCIGYRFMEEFSINALAILIGWVLTLFLACASGQRVIDEATSVADSVYNSSWYKRNVSFQKNIIIILLRSQKPIIIHAGPFNYVSHVTILTIFKTAYTYLTLLNTTSV